MNRMLMVSGIATLLMTAACRGRHAVSVADAVSPPAAVSVSTAPAQPRAIVERLRLTGTLTPQEQVTVNAKTAGYLKSLLVDVGDRVSKGQLVAVLEVPEVESGIREKEAALEKAEAGIEQARAAVDQSRSEAGFAQINYERLKSIRDRDRDVIPGQEVDQARAGLGVAVSRVKSAEAQVRAAEAAMSGARAELATTRSLAAYARVAAPLSGVVTERFVDPGALIHSASSGRAQGASLVTLARLDRLRVLVDVPEPSAPAVNPGTPATVQVLEDAQPISARVRRISRALDPASRTMRAEIELPNPGERLRPGMTARISFDLKTTANAVTVPPAALRGQGVDRTVFVIAGGRAREVKVETGVESPEWIQITKGLKAGEQVVIASAGLLKDGSRVSVTE